METRLTRSEQVRARRDLKKAGLLEEKLRGRPAKLFYRLNLNRLFECIMALVGPGGGSPSGGSLGGLAGNGGDNSVSFPPVIKDTDQGNTVGDIAADSALASAQAVKKKACENASLQDSASLKSDQEKVLKNSSLQDAAYSMSGLDLASGYQWDMGAENGLDNKALQSYPLSLGDSAFSLQDPAIKALNPANYIQRLLQRIRQRLLLMLSARLTLCLPVCHWVTVQNLQQPTANIRWMRFFRISKNQSRQPCNRVVVI